MGGQNYRIHVITEGERKVSAIGAYCVASSQQEYQLRNACKLEAQYQSNHTDVNKAQTEIVQHKEGQSLFEQTLELELNLVYNSTEGRFEPKFTEFSVVVIYQGKIKSGGYVKYDAAQIVNNNFSDETVNLQLLQCPDPQAHLEIVFNYEVMGDSSRSLFNELSMLNPTGLEQDLSVIDFHEEDRLRESQRPSNASDTRRTSQQSEPRTSAEMVLPIRLQEVGRMNTLLDRFEELARRGKVIQEDQSSTRYESVAPSYQEDALLAKVAQLQKQLEERDVLLKQCEEKIEVQAERIAELEKQVQSEQEKVAGAIKETEIAKALAERESRFHAMYEQTLAELEELRNSTADFNFSKQSMGFKRFLEQVNEVEDIPEFGAPPVSNPAPQQVQQLQLEQQNMELQGKIASMSHNIAQLFNAAYDYGGAKLLDYLQNSIGLIEQES